jgi:hypothetical protein
MILKEFGIPKKLAHLIKMTQHSNGKVKIQDQSTGAFNLERGLRRCNAMFNIVLEKVIRSTETKPNGTIFNRLRQHIAYANHVLKFKMFAQSD